MSAHFSNCAYKRKTWAALLAGKDKSLRRSELYTQSVRHWPQSRSRNYLGEIVGLVFLLSLDRRQEPAR